MNQEPYELLDFGDGRKLERFGDVVIFRPCLAAEGLALEHPELWDKAVARFRGPRTGAGSWSPRPAAWLPEPWNITFRISASNLSEVAGGTARPSDREVDLPLTFRLQPSPFGHVGVFPEQRDNWAWIARQVARARTGLDRQLRVLNLFAYTGGSTLAAALAGAEVVHIDSAHNTVDRARENATLSNLADRPIRWIPEDALKFCRREVKRGNQYDGVILDPPSHGHGPKGESWQIERDLLPLLTLVGQLTAGSRAFVLASCHSPGIGPAELAAYLAEGVFGHCGQPPATGDLWLQTATGRRLPSGVYARWPK